MIKFSNTSVMNFENALRGMRNPLQSWEKSDSEYCSFGDDCVGCPLDGTPTCDGHGTTYVIGPNDLALAKKLRNAGSDHRKFLRQIFVSVDICAPLYWWKEYDTYKISTVANSTSTMHTIHKKPFTRDDFSCDHMTDHALAVLDYIILNLNLYRTSYLETDDKKHWYDMIQTLPSSYNQTRTCTMNYENLINMYHSRKYHKLDEWRTFCEWVSGLPYAKELIIGGE
jgi:hypothetical protein